jgi:hypothetical protein
MQLANGHRAIGTVRGAALIAAVALSLGTRAALGQAHYYDTDAGRPTRVEDATATARHVFEWQIPSLRLERLDAGPSRWRSEPKVSYGILRRTAIEVRAPMVYREQSATPRAGLAGLGVGAFVNFNDETESFPALALASEVMFPAGGAATGSTTFSAKALLTRTFSFARIHLNASVGNYGVASVRPSAGLCGDGTFRAITGECTKLPPVIPDGPCTILTSEIAGGGAAQAMCMGNAAASRLRADTSVITTTGAHWVAGLGVDHAMPLRSLLLSADIFAEQFVGLFKTDWTAELGLRHQLSPRVVVDGGIGRHFAGVTPSWQFTLGATVATAVRFLTPVPH